MRNATGRSSSSPAQLARRMVMTQSRRNFLKSGAALAAASLLASRKAISAAADAPDPATLLSQFEYGDIELLEGPMRRQFDTNHAFYSALDEDMLLKPFRQRAGLPAPGDDRSEEHTSELQS